MVIMLLLLLLLIIMLMMMLLLLLLLLLMMMMMMMMMVWGQEREFKDIDTLLFLFILLDKGTVEAVYTFQTTCT